MKLATIRTRGAEAAVIVQSGRLFRISDVNDALGTGFPTDLFSLLQSGELDDLKEWFARYGSRALSELHHLAIGEADADFAPLYRNPRKIWGIGLNYAAHAYDLAEQAPTAEPASFMKPDTTIIGDGDDILLPRLSQRTTGEAELGLVFGKRCKNVPRKDWSSVLAGFTTIIDMTAEDILRRNPRNLTQSKSFDTFFSFGPIFCTVDEVEDVFNLSVSTVINGQVHAENVVSNMTFPPDFLVSYHSQIMTMLPGDIISTGTPGAALLSDGDLVECRIEGFKSLVNEVKDLKVRSESAKRGPWTKRQTRSRAGV